MLFWLHLCASKTQVQCERTVRFSGFSSSKTKSTSERRPEQNQFSLVDGAYLPFLCCFFFEEDLLHMHVYFMHVQLLNSARHGLVWCDGGARFLSRFSARSFFGLHENGFCSRAAISIQFECHIELQLQRCVKRTTKKGTLTEWPNV